MDFSEKVCDWIAIATSGKNISLRYELYKNILYYSNLGRF